MLGDNNVYPLRLREGGWLLVDAGLDYHAEDGRQSWDAVVAQASALGCAPREVRAVVITHAHIDHAGFAARWLELGARVLGGAADLDAIAAGAAGGDATRELRRETLRRHGCPEDVLVGLSSMRGRRGLRWAPCARGALEAAEGQRFDLADGATLEVVAAPGHTPGNLVCWNASRGELHTGDTLLPTTVPTPGLHFPGAIAGRGERARWPSLPPFLASVAALAELPVRRILPGHGQPVEDPQRLFDRFEAHHARRARRIAAALADGPATVFEVARTLFRRLPDERIGQAMTEILGHLDVFELNGRVRRVGADPVRYELIGEGAAGGAGGA